MDSFVTSKKPRLEAAAQSNEPITINSHLNGSVSPYSLQSSYPEQHQLSSNSNYVQSSSSLPIPPIYSHSYQHHPLMNDDIHSNNQSDFGNQSVDITNSSSNEFLSNYFIEAPASMHQQQFFSNTVDAQRSYPYPAALTPVDHYYQGIAQSNSLINYHPYTRQMAFEQATSSNNNYLHIDQTPVFPTHMSHSFNETHQSASSSAEVEYRDPDWDELCLLFSHEPPLVESHSINQSFLESLDNQNNSSINELGLSSIKGSAAILDESANYSELDCTFFYDQKPTSKHSAAGQEEDDEELSYQSIHFIDLLKRKEAEFIDSEYSLTEYSSLNIRHYSTKILTTNEKAFFILANDRKDILTPNPSSRARTIIVMSNADFSSDLLKINPGFDFLICDQSELLNFKKIAFEFSLLLEFSTIILFDSNISRLLISESISINDSTDFIMNLFAPYQQSSLILTLPIVSKKRSASSETASYAKMGSHLLHIDVESVLEIIKTNSLLQKKEDFHLMARFFLPYQASSNIDDYFLQMFIHELAKKEPAKKGFSQISNKFIMIEKSTSYQDQNPLLPYTASEISPELRHFDDLNILHMNAVKKLNKFIETKFNRYQEAASLTKAEALSKYSSRKEWAHRELAPVDLRSMYFSQNCEHIVHSWNSIKYKGTDIFKHQIDAIETIARWSKHREEEPLLCRNLLSIEMATGTGKTLVESLVAFAGFNDSNKSNVMIICPTISLVQQMYEKIAEYQEHISGLPSCAYVSPDSVIPISSEQAHLDKKLIAVNEELKSKHHLFVICQKTFLNMLESDEQDQTINPAIQQHFSKLIRETSLYIADESHEVLSEQVIKKLSEKKSTTSSIIAFSATPSNLVKKLSAPTSFAYRRNQAILDKIITPLIIDRSIDSEINSKIILNLTLHHEHLGQKLYQQKGIILVKRLLDIQSLLDEFNESELFRSLGINLYEVSSRNPKNDQAIKQFIEAEQGIMIGIEIPATGLDHDRLTWVICANAFKSSIEKSKDPYHEPTLMQQMIGRTLRFSRSIPEKTGLFITQMVSPIRNRVLSWHPIDQSTPQYGSSAIETLDKFAKKDQESMSLNESSDLRP